MTEQRFAEFKHLRFRESRIPPLDGISTFVPTGAEKEPVIQAALERKGYSRWTPVEGGHTLLILHEGEPFDATRFTLQKGGWDHEHCSSCRARIPSMTLCWVSDHPYAILCSNCHSALRGNA